MKVNDDIFERRMRKLDKLPKDVLREALPKMRSNTPKDKGYARSQTKLVGNKLKADYPYADRLNKGHSKQAPKGFTDPTIQDMDKIADRLVKRI